MSSLYLRVHGTAEFRTRATRLPDFSRERPLPSGFAITRLGCSGPEDERWYCHLARCLGETDEEFREACMEISHQIRHARSPSQELTGHYKEIADRYPRLHADYIAGVKAHARERDKGTIKPDSP